jgi:hypothetical protein
MSSSARPVWNSTLVIPFRLAFFDQLTGNLHSLPIKGMLDEAFVNINDFMAAFFEQPYF